MEKTISKDMVINDILAVDRDIIPILMRSGMHCVGCPSSAGETLEEASQVHGLDADKLVGEINTFLKSK